MSTALFEDSLIFFGRDFHGHDRTDTRLAEESRNYKQNARIPIKFGSQSLDGNLKWNEVFAFAGLNSQRFEAVITKNKTIIVNIKLKYIIIFH